MFKLKTSLLTLCSVAFVYLKKVFCSHLIFFYEALPRNSTSGLIFKAAQDQLLLVLAVL